MADTKTYSELAASGALDGSEIVSVTKKSATVTITAATISAAASDNSFNDSGDGFVAAGFADGDRVVVEGFTGNAANNLIGKVETTAIGKLIIEAPAGDAIVDEAAGDSVTITKLVSVRTTASDVAASGGGGGGGVAVEDDGVSVLAGATALNFTGAGVTVTDEGSGVAGIAIPGGGGGGGGNPIAIFRHEQASGVSAGTATAGAWATLTTNVEHYNAIAGASLASNEITLAAGTYRVTGENGFFRTARSRIRLYNVTDAAEEVIGTSTFSDNGTDGDTAKSTLDDVFVIGAEKAFRLEYRTEVSGATNGLGIASNFGTEIYNTLTFEKIA